jgi:S-adenosylmethionine:tRNA ribosyltransferase-isomerase
MHPRELSISDFTYALPDERITQQPLAERDASKLLVWRDGRITDRVFRSLPDELPEGALLVMNETRVVNARLVFHRSTGGRIVVLCLSPADGGSLEQGFEARGAADWQCFIGNAKRWRDGEQLLLEQGGVALRAERIGAERIRLSWQPAGHAFAEVLALLGHVPLPPYMKRPDAPADHERYNTVFARNEGSVAAPTASLHFTQDMLERIDANGIGIARLTLHVGAGTFLPVKSDRMEGHAMHREQVRVPLDAIKAIHQRLNQGDIIAVGTTALRTIESIYWHGAALINGRATEELNVTQWEPYEQRADLPGPAEALREAIRDLEQRHAAELTGHTQLLIAPGYRFRLADGLVTNFHQPQSTLLLLVAAFIGPDWRRVYEHALAQGYRFLSYGDGSLLWRRNDA